MSTRVASVENTRGECGPRCAQPASRSNPNRRERILANPSALNPPRALRGCMIGDKIGDTKGKTTNIRSLGVTNGVAVLESSFQDDGKIHGVDVHVIGSYTSTPRMDGTIFGEGSGIMMSREGDVVTWRAISVGRVLPTGASKWRVTFVFEPSTGKLAKWSERPAFAEYDVDPAGNQTGHYFDS